MFSKSTYFYNVLEAFKIKVSKLNLVKDARHKLLGTGSKLT